LEWSSDLLLDDDKRTIWQGGEMATTESWIEAQIEDGTSMLRQQMQLDQRVNLLSDLLVKMDMATMAHSLETRSPLLDHELAEYAMGLTDGELLRGGVTKSVLRRAYADLLPTEVLDGKKRGFEVPVERWLQTEWRVLLQDLLGAQEPEAAAYVDRRFLRDLISDRLEGDWNVPMLKYTMLVLELWLREQKS
jgi:asparagine synthase (glutamine-hydrolysing)